MVFIFYCDSWALLQFLLMGLWWDICSDLKELIVIIYFTHDLSQTILLLLHHLLLQPLSHTGAKALNQFMPSPPMLFSLPQLPPCAPCIILPYLLQLPPCAPCIILPCLLQLSPCAISIILPSPSMCSLYYSSLSPTAAFMFYLYYSSVFSVLLHVF